MAIYFNTPEGDIASIFIAYFGRAPEFDAMQHYVGVMEDLQSNPATAGNVFNLLAAHIYADGVTSQEVPAGPTVTNAWYVAYVYENILGRAPDAEGLAYWTGVLNAGTVSRAELVGTFIASALASDERDALYIENRTEVAVVFSQWENSNSTILPTLKYNAADVLIGVNEDPATVTEALTRMESYSGPVGDTFILTSGIDTFVGTTQDDTFNAVYDSNAAAGDTGSTLTPFDSIDGNLGHDTFNIYVTEDDNTIFPSTATVKNVEVINVFGGANADQSIRTVSHYEGAEEFWQIDSAGNVTDVGEGVAVGFRGMDAFASTITLADDVAAAQIVLDDIVDHAELFVSGESLDTVTVQGEIVDEEGGIWLAVIAGTDVRSLTVNTSVDTSLFVQMGEDSRAASTIQTLDLSGSTGDISFWLEEDQAEQVVNANAALTITFGSGDDLIVFEADSGRALTLRDNIDGGAGDNTVWLDIGGKLQTQNYDAIDRLVNFQNIGFWGDDVEVNAAELASYALEFWGDGAVVISNLATGQGVLVGGDGWDSSVTLKNAAKDVAIAFDSYEGSLQIGAAPIGATGGTLTLTGTGWVDFSNAESGKFAVIDASELAGVVTTLDDYDAFLSDLFDLPEGNAEITAGLLLASITYDDEGDLIGISSGMSGTVQETVRLNTAAMEVIMVGNQDLSDDNWGGTNSSTYGKMDVIEGFTSVGTATTPVDYLLGHGEIGSYTLSAGSTTLQLAFAEVAAYAYENADNADVAEVLFFYYGGDTYLFSETVATGQYDNGDFALKIVGQHDLTNLWVSPGLEYVNPGLPEG